MTHTRRKTKDTFMISYAFLRLFDNLTHQILGIHRVAVLDAQAADLTTVWSRDNHFL